MATDPLVGTTVGGYEILDVIGQGGMGVIYKARQKSLDRVVALKVLARHLASDVSFVTRFQKEARAIAKVNHRNILLIYDVADDQQTNYMAMELIEGRSLAELQAERRGAIPWEEATDYIRQAAQGLEAAQSAGIIHRDIKPENLMVTRKGEIKVSDFGLAKEADASSGATSVDAVMGTPAFMSPEQCDGKKVDGRSDIYSLGGTFYRLVTGRLPFEAETAMSMMYRHKHEQLIPPHEIVNTIPPALSAAIVKMMAKKREHRYQTMTEVIDALDAARKQAALPPAAPPVGAPADAVLSPIPPGASPFGMGAVPSDDQPPGFGAVDEPTAGLQVGPPMPSGRMPAVPGPAGGFAPASDSSSRLNMPSGVMGIAPSGLGAMPEAYDNVNRGDELLARGDRIVGLKCYRQALQSPSLDQASRARLEQEIRKEMSTRRQAMDSMLKRGMLVEAARECRVLAELDPTDETARNALKDLDAKLSAKRTMTNEVRTAIASNAFEKAIRIWDGTAAGLRDEGLGKQIEQLRSVVVPALKLAEQGDNFSRQGRLEEAMSSYEDALKINLACEPARLGQKETEQKLQRIEYMMKEGFQYSLEQNYAKAVDTWKPVLQLRPGHPQAVKGIVDAFVAHAQQLRAHGDLEGALAAYQGAIELDKQNRSVRRLLEDVTNVRDKEQALVDRAQDAAARNRPGAAIGYWKEVLRVNPSSKRALQQIEQLGHQRSRMLLKALAVLLVLAAIGAAGYQYYTEMRVLRSARAKMQQGQYGDLASLLRSTRFLIFQSDKQQLIAEAGRELKIVEAENQAKVGNLLGAARILEDLTQELRRAGDQRAATLAVRALEFTVQHAADQAQLVLRAGKWTEAARQFSDLRALVPESMLANPRLAELRAQADKAAVLALKVSSAEQARENRARALADLKDALKLAQDLQFAECVERISAMLARLNFDPDKFERLKEAGKSELARDPPDFAAARKAFNAAREYNPDDATIQQSLQYLDDVALCAGAGMSLFALRHPLRGGAWGGDERRAAFCIDRYEWPNKAGGLPQANLSWVEARKLCEDAGKKLCSAGEWEDACKGEARTLYPYGKEPDPAACNTDGRAAVPSGSKTACRNSIGVFDMSGNLAEWTDRGGDAEVRGGAFDTPARQASCIDVLQQDKSAASARVGFRCCRRLPDAVPGKP